MLRKAYVQAFFFYLFRCRFTLEVRLGTFRSHAVIKDHTTLCLLVFILSVQQKIIWGHILTSRSQWPHGLRHRSTAARLLRSWVRIPPGAWVFVCCEYCVLSGRGLCDGLIVLSEESYRLWRVVVCDQVTSYARRLKPDRGL